MSTQVPIKTVMRKLNHFRDVCREQGTPDIQSALDAVEDYWSHLVNAGVKSLNEFEYKITDCEFTGNYTLSTGLWYVENGDEKSIVRVE